MLAAGVFVMTGVYATAAAPDSGRVTGVRFWSLGDVTRIAIEVSSDFTFKYNHLTDPERMFFDIHGDEALPYVFVAGSEMLEGFSPQQMAEQQAVREGDDGAIVVIGNCSAVKPRVKRRMRFGKRHEQPQRERQNSRREKNPFACAAIYFIFESHFSLQTEGIKATFAPKQAEKFASEKLPPAHCQPRNV